MTDILHRSDGTSRSRQHAMHSIARVLCTKLARPSSRCDKEGGRAQLVAGMMFVDLDAGVQRPVGSIGRYFATTGRATNRVPVGAASRSRALQLRVEASRSAGGIWHRYLYPLVAVPSTQASGQSMPPDQDADAPRTDSPSASGNGPARKALARAGTFLAVGQATRLRSLVVSAPTRRLETRRPIWRERDIHDPRPPGRRADDRLRRSARHVRLSHRGRSRGLLPAVGLPAGVTG